MWIDICWTFHLSHYWNVMQIPTFYRSYASTSSTMLKMLWYLKWYIDYKKMNYFCPRHFNVGRVWEGSQLKRIQQEMKDNKNSSFIFSLSFTLSLFLILNPIFFLRCFQNFIVVVFPTKHTKKFFIRSTQNQTLFIHCEK